MVRKERRGPVRARVILVVALVLSSGIGAPVAGASTADGSPAADRPTTAAAHAPRVVLRRPCPDSDFTCITLGVPLDHFGPANGPTTNVTFALLRASGGPRKGVFVTATGGPGSSGISVADSYTSALDPRIAEEYDIVFFDQRGIGLSGPLQCPDSVLAFYTEPAIPTLSAAQAREYARAARTFSADCVDEIGIKPSRLAAYATRQAIEDLELFRTWLKADDLHLYGESYGTQYAQAYASAHPDRVATLLLDGPVDLTLTGTEYYAEDVHAFEDSLTFALDACTAIVECAADIEGGDALAAWDELATELRDGPITYEFVNAAGRIEEREFGFGDLETATAGYVYSNFDQMLLQRAVAQASRGELLPMARLTWISLGQDPETLDAIEDPTYSDALFYAVECMDYAYGHGNAARREADYLAAGVAAGVSSVRLGSIFYGDLPCASWPVHPATEARPDYLTDTPFPIVVLASTTDPATPYAGALRIFENATDGYLISQPGGPHVIFGRGNPCPDDLITDLLLDGTLPERETTCEPMSPDPYLPVPAASLTDDLGALEAMVATDDEINYSPDYWAWDGVDPLAVGCLNGGRMTYEPTAVGYRVQLRRCELTAGLPLTGHAVIDDVEGTFRLTVESPGGTSLRYLRDADGAVSVTGRWRGERV